MKLLVIYIFSFVLFSYNGFSSDELKAFNYAKKAITALQSDNFQRAIELLDSAIAHDPENIIYHYEKGLAYYYQKQFATAISILEPLTEHPDANERIYQLLGNCYDLINELDNAEKFYEKGLELFPKSGRLFLEMGTITQSKKSLREASTFWETGVKVQPEFDMNYYALSLYYIETIHRIWSVLYGEIFLNITQNQAKAEEISLELFKTYYKSLKTNSDTGPEVRFSYIWVNLPPDHPDSFNIPFDMAFQKVMVEAANPILSESPDEFTIKQLSKIRQRFIELWFEYGYDKNFPNPLFSHLKKFLDNGLFEAYNYVIFNNALPDEFDAWQSKNQATIQRFVQFFSDNPLILNRHNFISRFKDERLPRE